jgi:hypothetical protein
MNTALYILNALALVALVSFQVDFHRKDPALVHVPTEQWVARPAAQWASMGAQGNQAAYLAADRATVHDGDQPIPVQHPDRYTF